MKPICVLATILFLSPTLLSAQSGCDSFFMRELAPSPAFAGEQLQVRVFGSWGNASRPFLEAVVVSGQDIRVAATGMQGGPAGPEVQWEQRLDVGVLQAGDYDLYVDWVLDEGTVAEVSGVCGPTIQSVLASPVPFSSEFGLLMTGVLIVLAAHTLLRRGTL